MATTVRAADGAQWRVGRRWVPRRPRWRGAKPERVLDAVDVGADAAGFFDDVSGLALLGIVVGGIATALLAVLFVFPLVVLAVEVLLVAALAGGVATANVLFRRPWIVEASSGGRTHRTWKRVGWRASGTLIADIRRALESGAPLPF